MGKMSGYTDFTAGQMAVADTFLVRDVDDTTLGATGTQKELPLSVLHTDLSAFAWTEWSVDNLKLDGNTLSSISGNINISPVAGSNITLDGTITVDAGVVTGITSLGVTGTRVTNAYIADLTMTNAIAGSVTGNAATVTVTDTTYTSAYVGLFEEATGSLGCKTDAGITYNASTGALTATLFSGATATQTAGDATTKLASTAYVDKLNIIGTQAAPITDNPYNITAANCYGSLLFYGATGIINLPTGVAGMNLIVYNTGAFAITINPPDTTGFIVIDGVLNAAGQYVQIPSGAGNFVSLVCYSADLWVTVGAKGTLVAE